MSPSASVEASSPQNPDATPEQGAAGESAASHEPVTASEPASRTPADEPTPAAPTDAAAAAEPAPEPPTEPPAAASNQDNAWALAAEANAEPTPELPPLPQSFDELALPDALRRAIARLGWTKPSPVQALSFEPLIAGRDVMVQSHTGSGKTGAFCVPWLASRFDPRPADETGVQLLVLLPTRELAKQVCDELRRLAVETPVDVLPVYGGTPMNPQLTALRAGVHAVVGTPGRILDHIRRRSLDLSKVRTVVLDECDEMLSMGFLEDIRAILDQVKGEHLTALFSATIPNDIERIAKRYMKDPVSVQLSGDQVAAAEIEHAFYSVTSSIKTRDLLDVIMVEDPARAIIFCNTREETKLVASVLRREGFHAEELSSDLNQTQRERVMKLMREHKLRFLVATDVAARGIDISHVTHVINYSFPESAEVYVHRTGRTGRAGRTGVAISLINPREIGNFYYLKLQYSSIVFSERHLPPAEQLAAERTEFKLDGISKRFPELVSPEWVLLARSLMGDPRGERVIALLLERAMRAAPRPESIIDPDEIQPQAGESEDDRVAAPTPAPGPGETIEREQRDLREHREPREPRPSFGDRDRPRGDRDRGRGGDRDRPRFGDRDRHRRDDEHRGDRPRRDDGERSFSDRPRRDDSTGEPRPDGEPRNDRHGSDRPGFDRPRREDGDRNFSDRPRREDGDRNFSDRPRREDGDRNFSDRPRRDDRPQGDRPQGGEGDNRERRPDGFRLEGERRPDARSDAPREPRPDGFRDRGEGRDRDRGEGRRDRYGRRRDRHESRDAEPRPSDARPHDARPNDARQHDDGERRRRRDRHADPAQLPLHATGSDLAGAAQSDPPTPVLAPAPVHSVSAPAPDLTTDAAATAAVTLASLASPAQLPLWARGRIGDKGSFARVALSATTTATSSTSTTGDAGSEAVSGEPGDGRRKRRRRRRRGRRGEGEATTDATGESGSDADDDDSDEPESTGAPTGAPVLAPLGEPGTGARNDTSDSEAGDSGDRGRKRRRRRRNGRDGRDNRGPDGRDNRGPDGRDNRGPDGSDHRGPDGRDARYNRDNRDNRDVRPQPAERRPEPPPAPVGVPVAVPRRMAQDEIIIDIDETELEVVQSEFGGIEDEFDEFALMDRRQAVIETLQEEVELEDVSRSDASRLQVQVEDDDDDDDDTADEAETTDEPAVAATPSPEGETTEASEAETDGDERKRKRRRRRKKPAPLVMPELTAPPHKDFWEVWAAKYTYQDFEDGKYTPPNDVPEVADEPPPAPVLSDRSRGPRPPPPRSNGPRTSPPRSAPRPSGPDGGAPPPRVPVVHNAHSEADDGEFLKVCLNLGRSHGHKAATLRGLLRDELGLEGRAIRDLTVRDADTLFRIHHSELPRIQGALSQIRSDTPLTIAPVEDDADALRAPPPDVLAEALASLPAALADEPIVREVEPTIAAEAPAEATDSASDT